MSRQLDAAIAKALGFVVWEGSPIDSPYNPDKCDSANGYCMGCLPHYSTDGNAMLELDGEMRERGYDYLIRSVVGWRGKEESKEIEVVFYKNNNEQVTGWRSKKEMPLIFTKQAYWALTGNEWQGE